MTADLSADKLAAWCERLADQRPGQTLEARYRAIARLLRPQPAVDTAGLLTDVALIVAEAQAHKEPPREAAARILALLAAAPTPPAPTGG